MPSRSKLAAVPTDVSAPRIDDDRRRLALEATYQIHGLFEALQELAAPLEIAENVKELAVLRALALRGESLASVLNDVLGDELASLDDARATVEARDMSATTG